MDKNRSLRESNSCLWIQSPLSLTTRRKGLKGIFEIICTKYIRLLKSNTPVRQTKKTIGVSSLKRKRNENDYTSIL